jgi:hypothetical protein
VEEGSRAEVGSEASPVDSGWVHEALINGGALAVVRVQVLIAIETLPSGGKLCAADELQCTGVSLSVLIV